MRVHGVLLTGSSDTSELESSTAPLRSCCSEIVVVYEHGFVEGVKGLTRTDYLRAGLRCMAEDATLVVFVDDRSVDLADLDAVGEMIAGLEQGMAGLVHAVPVTDALKRIQHDEVVAGVDRERLYVAETPQVFDRRALEQVLARFPEEAVGDPAALLLRAGERVGLLPTADTTRRRLAAQGAEDPDGEAGW